MLLVSICKELSVTFWSFLMMSFLVVSYRAIQETGGKDWTFQGLLLPRKCLSPLPSYLGDRRLQVDH
jgi:hypothetical protein